MSDASPRIVDWLSSVPDLLREPMTTMPNKESWIAYASATTPRLHRGIGVTRTAHSE
jgi:hypothetical protein